MIDKIDKYLNESKVSTFKQYADSWNQIYPALSYIANGKITDENEIMKRVKIVSQRAETIQDGLKTLEAEQKEIIDHLFWIAGAFNTALNTQKQYEVVKNNKETRKKLNQIFTLLKKWR
jgi:hypothetical protein